MIKSVTVTNPKGEKLCLELTRPETSGLYVKTISGLGPPKATINISDLASSDGGMFSSARSDERDILLTLGMLWAPTIEAARMKTYQFFPLKKQIELQVETDSRKAIIKGYVESNEPDIFSKDEIAPISILCPDPLFREASMSYARMSLVDPLFEFPFSNESLEEPLLEFGAISFEKRARIPYAGDADTGAVITLHCLDEVRNVTLYNVATKEKMVIDTDKIAQISGENLRAGDDIIISTIKNDKYIRLLRDGLYTNVIGALGRDTDWFQLSAGMNQFGFYADAGEKDLVITFAYRNAYWGV